MSFDADKKREHAAAAETAMQEGNLRGGAFHMAKAAEFALKLSDKTDGRIRRGFVTEARARLRLPRSCSRRPKPPAPIRPAGPANR